MSRTRAGMTAYKNASPGRTVEVAGGKFLPVDGFGTIEMNPGQPGSTAKSVRMVAVTYVPGLLWSLLSILKGMKQGGKVLLYYKTKAVLGFP